MLVIGLIGTVCSGKSVVAGALREAGAEVFSADEEVHRIYRLPSVKRQVRKAFGDGVFSPDGEVDRAALGRAVFGDSKKLEILTGRIVYPRVKAGIAGRVRAARRKKDSAKALVLDAPTLLEAGCGKICDRILFVTAPIGRRRRWAKAGRGWGTGEIEKRERHMIGEAEKRKLADKVIENTGSLGDLKARAIETWKEWIHAVRP